MKKRTFLPSLILMLILISFVRSSPQCQLGPQLDAECKTYDSFCEQCVIARNNKWKNYQWCSSAQRPDPTSGVSANQNFDDIPNKQLMLIEIKLKATFENIPENKQDQIKLAIQEAFKHFLCYNGINKIRSKVTFSDSGYAIKFHKGVYHQEIKDNIAYNKTERPFNLVIIPPINIPWYTEDNISPEILCWLKESMVHELWHQVVFDLKSAAESFTHRGSTNIFQAQSNVNFPFFGANTPDTSNDLFLYSKEGISCSTYNRRMVKSDELINLMFMCQRDTPIPFEYYECDRGVLNFRQMFQNREKKHDEYYNKKNIKHKLNRFD